MKRRSLTTSLIEKPACIVCVKDKGDCKETYCPEHLKLIKKLEEDNIKLKDETIRLKALLTTTCELLFSKTIQTALSEYGDKGASRAKQSDIEKLRSL